jgi:hypothetical protein
MGVIQAPGGDIGVLGTASGQPNIMWGEIGVMGITNTFGVVGKGLGSLIEENGNVVLSSIGVHVAFDEGIGLEDVATSGWRIGRSGSRAGVTGTSDSNAGVNGASKTGVGVVGQSDDTIGVWGLSDSGLLARGSPRVVTACLRSLLRSRDACMSPMNAAQGVSNGPAATSIGGGPFDKGTGVQGD